MRYLALLALLLPGCFGHPPPREFDEVSRIEHDGHAYLRFYRLGSTSFVHDPECECR